MEHATWPLDRLTERMAAEDPAQALAWDIEQAKERLSRARLAWDAEPDEPARRAAYYRALDDLHALKKRRKKAGDISAPPTPDERG